MDLDELVLSQNNNAAWGQRVRGQLLRERNRMSSRVIAAGPQDCDRNSGRGKKRKRKHTTINLTDIGSEGARGGIGDADTG